MVKEFVVDYNTETFEPLMEHEVNGLDYKYVYGNDRLSVDISPINNSGKLIENGDHIRLYYHMDYLGTADYLTSPVSLKVEAWTHYNEWGLISHNAVLKCGQRELDLVKRYATHDYDSVLELYYAKARFYDAHDRRFTAVDPILEPSQYDPREYVQNPVQFVQYLYVQNQPLAYIDPLGLWTISISYGGSFAAGIYGAGSAGIIFDDKGNVDFVVGWAVGGGTTSAGSGFQVQVTSAKTIWDTRGTGFEAGGSLLGFSLSYIGGSARDGSYVHGISFTPQKIANLAKFESVLNVAEKALNAAFKAGSIGQKIKAVGNIAELHGAVTHTYLLSEMFPSITPKISKTELKSIAKEYYYALTCSLFRYAVEHILGLKI